MQRYCASMCPYSVSKLTEINFNSYGENIVSAWSIFTTKLTSGPQEALNQLLSASSSSDSLCKSIPYAALHYVEYYYTILTSTEKDSACFLFHRSVVWYFDQHALCVCACVRAGGRARDSFVRLCPLISNFEPLERFSRNTIWILRHWGKRQWHKF